MLTKLVRTAAALALLGAASAGTPGSARGATQKEIDHAIKTGADALKGRFATGNAGADTTIGPACLAGLALLEAGVPPTDRAVKAITDRVRDDAYGQVATYGVALSVMFLDRLGDPADAVRIQTLAVRLLASQTPAGGWGYATVQAPTADEQKWLRAIAGPPPAGKLHPDVERYAQSLAGSRPAAGTGDDNSNTQFAVMAVWMSRKHGVPAEAALDLIEKRFAGTQDARTGNWPYSGGAPAAGNVGSPAMYCAGLLGMATAVARREERRKGDPAKPPPKPKDPAKANDPFYNPPAPAAAPKKEEARPTDVRDATVQRAFAGLGATVADRIRAGQGLFAANNNGGHGQGDLYFLWSLERVGVVFGLDKVGGFDWYDLGSTALVRSQGADGLWTVGGYGPEINTAFAVLFLCRSNLAKDLSSKVQKDPTSTEMRAGAGPSPVDVLPTRPAAVAAPVLDLPNPTGDEAIAAASKLLKAPAADWKKLLDATRDAKGPTHTRALVVLANNTDGDRKKDTREALAERLCRMTPDTLRGMLKANEPELRRAAALACAMKDDKAHVPDLVDAMGDAEGTVVRAAKAGLKSLTGKDFATAAEWRDWLAKEKK